MIQIRHAEKWAKSRNPSYDDYSNGGGDCANFVSQCLIAGGFSTIGCEGNYGKGNTILYVLDLENCLIQKGWKSSSSIPSNGMPAGGVITFNSGQHATLCVQGGLNPLIAGHTEDIWMGNSNWGVRTYFWDPNAGSGSGGDSGTNSYIWFPYVNGYDTSNSNNGLTGDYGTPVVALKIKTGTYAVHETGGTWLSAVKNDRVAGRGKPIDAIAIKEGVRYRVHVMNGGWLSEVNGYDFNDDNNGYAGILGRTIDAIAINGKTYATAY